MSTSTDNEVFDPQTRRLCPDGSCVGLLDDDGRCKVCRTVGVGTSAPVAITTAIAQGGAAVFNPGRALCPDGSCIGVIDAHGRCPLCGQTRD